MDLLVIQNGRQHRVETKPLRDGALGNLETLAVIIPMVREDARGDLELRKFAQSLIAECAPRDFHCEVGKLFEFARSIHFVLDPIDTERVADAATTRAEGFGDCGDKAILLASLLGCVGYLSRFVAVNFYDDLATNGFDHLYIEVELDDGTWLPLDATPENAPPGWEASAPVRQTFDIWPPPKVGLGGLLDQLIGQGVQFGTQLAAGAYQQSQLSAAQEKAAGAEFDRRDIALAAAVQQLEAQPAITAEQFNAAVAAIQQLAAFAAQFPSIGYVQRQLQSEMPRYEAALQALAGRVSGQAAASVGSQQLQTAGTTATAASNLFSNPWVLIVLGLSAMFLLKE